MAWRFYTPNPGGSTGWQDFVPVWSSSGTQPVLGNGTITGRYVQIGKTVHCRITLVMGSTTTFGTGAYRFSIPVLGGVYHSSGPLVGTGQAGDSGVGSYMLGIRLVDPTVVDFVTTANPAANVAPSTPFTFGTNDNLSACFTYEAA